MCQYWFGYSAAVMASSVTLFWVYFLATSSHPANLRSRWRIDARMKIAIIGSGRIGGVVGKLWAQAGHQVRFSARRPDRLDRLVAESGPNASRSSIEEALRDGEVGDRLRSRRPRVRRRNARLQHQHAGSGGAPGSALAGGRSGIVGELRP